ncbi:pali-domain-containing protein [Panus rudis PR-1116 ss-1]|nr:pali-domain-containing protein [Panus rudis PR-1116 ss-1]
MSRAFHIPGIIFLFIAFVLLFLVSISLPFLTALDFARVHIKSGSPTIGNNNGVLTELRYGIWAYCWYDNSGQRTCSPSGHAYQTTVYNDQNRSSWVTVGSSWTRGLAVHPVATGVTLIAFILSLSSHITMRLLAALVSFLAALLTLIAFAIDIALYAWVKHQIHNLDGVSSNTNTAPGFWLTFVSFILLMLAGCTVCFGRRRDRMGDATSSYAAANKRSWRDRFRRTSTVGPSKSLIPIHEPFCFDSDSFVRTAS